jgi:HK97 family phage major capsid protein
MYDGTPSQENIIMAIDRPTQLRAEIAELETERAALSTELDALAADPNRSARQITTRSNEIAARGTEITALIADKSEYAGELDVLAAERSKPTGPNFFARSEPNDRVGWADEDRGRSVIDDAVRSGILPDHAAARATALIESGHPGERSIAARWATAAGDPAYRGAFAKMLADPERGHLLWSPEEAHSYRQVAAVKSEMEGRAMTTTGSAGGFMIPLSLDPAILLTSDGSNNPLRQLASIRQTMTNTWQGVTSAGATSEWKTEEAEAADGSPTLASPSIPVFTGDSFVPYSYEVGMDALNFLDELAQVLVDSADNLQSAAYTTGTGSGQPQGIVTGLVGTASEINGQGAEALAATDPFDLQNALPARFSANATWQGHIATMNTYRGFETSNGALMFPELRNNPPHLLGKRFFENSNMDGAIDPAATANNYVAIYGDVAKGFFIVDRVGSSLELIPNLIGANQRPTGQRGALLWFRTGSEVVVPQALRLLDIPTTA